MNASTSAGLMSPGRRTVKTAGWRLKIAVGAVAATALVGAGAAPAMAAGGWYDGCGSYSASFYSADNSGIDRGFSMNTSLSKSCGAYYKVQYKINFSNASSSWHTGISKYTNGTERKIVTDNFYYPNYAVGSWVRICGYTFCAPAQYIDNPLN
jgi:hypothetical protein